MADIVYNYTWDELSYALQESGIDKKGARIYGVPNGGMVLCLLLTRAVVVYSPEEATLILDDIEDSGGTRKFYAEKYPTIPFYALIQKYKPGWVSMPWERQHPKSDMGVEENIVRVLQYLGQDTGREGLSETPRRVVKSWDEIYGGYHKNPEDLLTVFEKESYDQLVILNDIELYSTCEHHMLPFYGKAHVAYLPDKKVIGISKLARVVDMYARRLQIQERIGEQVTTALMDYLKPKGAACYIEASHMCMRMRGVNKQNSVMKTISLRGALREDDSLKREFLDSIR